MAVERIHTGATIRFPGRDPQEKPPGKARGARPESPGQVQAPGKEMPVVRGEKTPEEAKKETKPVAFEKFFQRGVRLEVEEELKMVIAKIVDSRTGEVLKQIPPEELVKIYRRLKELSPDQTVKGSTVKKEA